MNDLQNRDISDGDYELLLQLDRWNNYDYSYIIPLRIPKGSNLHSKGINNQQVKLSLQGKV